MKLPIKIVTILSLMLPPSLLTGQDHISNLHFIHHNTDDGLSQRKVKCITQDSLGYMWFGTEAGINRFDGYEYTLYQSQNAEKENRLNKDINMCYTDSKGNVWYSAIHEGLKKIDISTNKIIEFSTLDTLECYQERIYHDILEQNDVYYLLSENALYKVQQMHNRITAKKYVWKINNSSNLGLFRLHIDQKEQIWVSTIDGKLAQFKNGRFIDHTKNINEEGFKIKQIYSLTSDRNGNLFIGTSRVGIIRYNPENKTAEQIVTDPSEANPLTNCQVTDIQYIDGNIWVGTFGCGLYIFDSDFSSFKHFTHSKYYETSLSDNFIYDIFIDKSNSIWISTAHGVDLVSKTPVVQVKNTYSKESLNDEDILAIEEDNKGYIWIGTRNGGLNRYDHSSGQFKHFAYEPNNDESLSNNSVEAVFEDSQKRLWVGTRNGLNLRNDNTNKFIRFKNSSNANSLVYNIINCITEDSEGYIWIGTDGGGVSRLNPETLDFKNFVATPDDNTSLSNNSVRTIHVDHNDNIWIGTYFGLNRFNPDDNTFKSYFPVENDSTSLNAAGVVSMHTDRKSRLLVGTYGGGLAVYNYDQDNFFRITKVKGSQAILFIQYWKITWDTFG